MRDERGCARGKTVLETMYACGRAASLNASESAQGTERRNERSGGMHTSSAKVHGHCTPVGSNLAGVGGGALATRDHEHTCYGSERAPRSSRQLNLREERALRSHRQLNFREERTSRSHRQLSTICPATARLQPCLVDPMVQQCQLKMERPRQISKASVSVAPTILPGSLFMPPWTPI